MWVFEGEGVATRKYDGTCCKIENGKFFKRREIKKDKKAPIGFIRVAIDPNTGKRVGWIEVDPNDKGDKWHVEAMASQPNLQNGTYELCGPKVQGNPEKYDKHILISHSDAFQFSYCPTDYEELRQWLYLLCGEGVVWHHPDGRMAKIKKRDFG